MLEGWIFWKAAFERAVKTVAQSAVAILAISVTGLIGVDWLSLVSVSGLAGLISILTSIGSDVATGGTGPSLTNEIAVKTKE